jgi:hypothetical protein
MTTWANAAVNSGGSEKFHGDVFMLSNWYNF